MAPKKKARSEKPPERQDCGEAGEGEIKDVPAVIDLLSTVVTAMVSEQKDFQIVLENVATTFQDVQASMQSANLSMVISDAIIGDVLQEPKPVLKAIPEAKSLPDGFRYKPDLADPSSQALHLKQCINWVRDLSEKQVRKNFHRRYISLLYQHRPS